MIGTQIGVYKITRLLGEGGMGTVYEAVQEQLGKRVAIKVLHRELARNTEGLARFFNEARAVNVIEHPGLVQIFEFGQLPSGSAYLVMEHLQGETLGDRLKQLNRLPEPVTLYMCYQLAAILAAAHERGIVHRDLKPSNIMLVPDSAMPSGERIKLLDFGVAKLASTLHEASSSVRTNSRQTLGTPQYMSPEQCRDVSQVDGMTDVYALGVILYEMLAGRTPFAGLGEFAVAAMHLYEEPPLLSLFAPGASEPTLGLVHRMLRKPKEERPTMANVLTVLQTMGISITASTQKASAVSMGGNNSGAILVSEIQAAEALARFGEPSMSGPISIPPPADLPGPYGAANPSTLGSGIGQLTRGAGSRRWLMATVAGFCVLAGLLLAGSLRTGSKPVVIPPAQWQVTTIPPGATVLSSEGGLVLGKTPWHYQQPSHPGKQQVSIQLQGFQTHTLTLDNSRDEKLDLILESVPVAKIEPLPVPPKHRSRPHKAKPEETPESPSVE